MNGPARSLPREPASADALDPLGALSRRVRELLDLEPRGGSLRRLGPSAVDARIYLPRPLRAAEGAPLVAALTAEPALEEVRVRGAELTVRFSAEHLVELRRRLAAGRTALLGPGPASGQRVTLNFLNPNATKPLHVGHLRNVALGQALWASLAAAGAQVRRQAYVCDIGRNVAEAMAGWELFHRGASPASTGLPSDVFVGRCYADFARTRTESGTGLDPVESEGLEVGDRADEWLGAFAAGDPRAREDWEALRRWALEGQQRTLARLGVRFDRVAYESEALVASRQWADLGLARGTLQRTAEGAVVYATGRADYGRLPLLRADGFPTEHLRVIALFLAEQAEAARPARWIVVCGDEWSAAGAAELEVAGLLEAGPLIGAVEVVAHGMVTLGGSKMKSRDGRALLADELLDQLERDPRLLAWTLESAGGVSAAAAAQLLVFGAFLCRRPQRAIEFDGDGLFDPTHNPAVALVRAWCRVAGPDAGPAAASGGGDEAERTLLLQAHQLRQLCFRTDLDFAPTELAKFTIGLAAWFLEQPLTPALQRTARDLFAVCLEVLGLGRIAHGVERAES
jgi:arginyl-tRNA synthetase